jgi:RNase P subunit RPR2
MKINAKIKETYLHDPESCPKCKSTDIEGDSAEFSFNQAWRDVTCNNCGEFWRELFTLTDIEEI